MKDKYFYEAICYLAGKETVPRQIGVGFIQKKMRIGYTAAKGYLDKMRLEGLLAADGGAYQASSLSRPKPISNQAKGIVDDIETRERADENRMLMIQKQVDQWLEGKYRRVIGIDQMTDKDENWRALEAKGYKLQYEEYGNGLLKYVLTRNDKPIAELSVANA